MTYEQSTSDNSTYKPYRAELHTAGEPLNVVDGEVVEASDGYIPNTPAGDKLWPDVQLHNEQQQRAARGDAWREDRHRQTETPQVVNDDVEYVTPRIAESGQRTIEEEDAWVASLRELSTQRHEANPRPTEWTFDRPTHGTVRGLGIIATLGLALSRMTSTPLREYFRK